jgi:hypothetical protein
LRKIKAQTQNNAPQGGDENDATGSTEETEPKGGFKEERAGLN